MLYTLMLKFSNFLLTNNMTYGVICTISCIITYIINKFMFKKTNKFTSKVKYNCNVTGMDPVAVSDIVQVTSKYDIIDTVKRALDTGKHISMFGQKHTMGGHISAKDGIVLDMNCMDKFLHLDKENKMITVESGITWAKIIKFLDPHGLSPMVLQSYSTFSVGGSMAVNIHGITSDRSLCESIISFKMITSNLEDIECSRTKNQELFGLVIGGYGLFGTVYEVTLRVTDNARLKMKSERLTIKTFSKKYEQFIENNKIGVKLGRINVTNFDNIMLYYFEKENGSEKCSSNVGSIPREMSRVSSLVYKWIMGTNGGKKLRFLIENILRKPLDWSVSCTTNGSLYESTYSFANLWSPIININKTHILQEFFVPHDKLEVWLENAGNFFKSHEFKNVSLLNATIRYVMKDETTYLNYARENMYAIVLYYRIDKLYEGDMELQNINCKLLNITLEKCNGTFYLPYRHHYSNEQLMMSYPQFNDFAKKKQLYDPNGVFCNEWFKHYSTRVACANKVNFVDENDKIDLDIEHSCISDHDVTNVFDSQAVTNVFDSQVGTVLKKHQLINFGTYVFNMADPKKTLQVILDNSQNEKACYMELANIVNNMKTYEKIKRQFHVLKTQKTELVNSTIELLKRGQITSVKNMVAIGDPGRYVKEIRNKFTITGKTFIVHDSQQITDIVERGSLFKVGKYVKINYDNIDKNYLQGIQDGTVDLVTCYIGLHHFEEEDLNNFLIEVSRVLSENGVFILRDHNGTDDIKPLLCFAHSYFNALTGVSYEDDKKEVRLFRSIKEWRELLSKYNLIDTRIYKKQLHDPTENYLMMYTKKQLISDEIRECAHTSKTYRRNYANGFHTVPEWGSVELFDSWAQFMHHTPFYMFSYWTSIFSFWKLFLKQIKECAKRTGYKNALINEGTIMNLTIGSLITCMFMPLCIICFPIRLVYTNPNFADNLEEECLVRSTDDKINKYKCFKKINDQYHISIPRYEKFTEEIKMMSTFENTEILEIGGHKKILIRMTPNDEIFNFPTVNKINEYQINETTRKYVIIEINVNQLLNFVKIYDQYVNHIFDY